MQQSEKVELLFKALINVQSKLTGAKKDAANQFFKSKYADLESCWESARPILAANELCIIQTTGLEGAEVGLYTTLAHSSGQWMRGFLPLNMKAKDPQGQGSAITYARRYAMSAIIGLIQTDDDGEAAMGRKEPFNSQPAKTDGVQKDGYTMPAIAGSLAQQYLNDIPKAKLEKWVDDVDKKYEGKVIPPALNNVMVIVTQRIVSLESGNFDGQ